MHKMRRSKLVKNIYGFFHRLDQSLSKLSVSNLQTTKEKWNTEITKEVTTTAHMEAAVETEMVAKMAEEVTAATFQPRKDR